jgi:hypothetical protein
MGQKSVWILPQVKFRMRDYLELYGGVEEARVGGREMAISDGVIRAK